MVMSFNDSDIALMNSNQLSSVYCESRNARLAVQAVMYSVETSRLHGAVIIYTVDCLPSTQGLQKMGASPNLCPEIKQLLLFAAHHDVHVEIVWQSLGSHLACCLLMA